MATILTYTNQVSTLIFSAYKDTLCLKECANYKPFFIYIIGVFQVDTVSGDFSIYLSYSLSTLLYNYTTKLALLE
jgi:hypothetical protein